MDTTIINEDEKALKAGSRLLSRGILIILSEKGFGTTYIVDSDKTVVGRGEKADFSISDDLISREHCRILRDADNHFHIEDLQSTNSSSINGKKLKKMQQLCYGDKITLGQTIMRFFREESKLP